MKLHLQYGSEKSAVTVADEVVEVKAHQIIVWVSISSKVIPEWDSRIPKLPAILDTGTTHNFAVSKQHLSKWAGLHSSELTQLGRIRLEGKRVPLYDAVLWLHTDVAPFKLTTHDGIAEFDEDWPRLPVLGLRALTNSSLQTLIYGDTKRVVIRTPPPWYWPF